jgi:hypothetical protein
MRIGLLLLAAVLAKAEVMDSAAGGKLVLAVACATGSRTTPSRDTWK